MVSRSPRPAGRCRLTTPMDSGTIAARWQGRYPRCAKRVDAGHALERVLCYLRSERVGQSASGPSRAAGGSNERASGSAIRHHTYALRWLAPIGRSSQRGKRLVRIDVDVDKPLARVEFQIGFGEPGDERPVHFGTAPDRAIIGQPLGDKELVSIRFPDELPDGGVTTRVILDAWPEERQEEPR